MSFSQEGNWPGMKFLAWWRKQWCFHWSQGCVPCELLSNFKILKGFLNFVAVFKCTLLTKKRPVAWLNAQICSVSPMGLWWGHWHSPGEVVTLLPALCKLSSQKPNSWALSRWVKLQWWSNIYLGQLLAPYQFICSPFSRKQLIRTLWGRFCVLLWNMLNILNKRVIIVVRVGRTMWSHFTQNDMQALVSLPFRGTS